MSSRLSFFIDLVIFQIAWFACVLASVSPFPILIPILGTLLVIIRCLVKKSIKQSLPFTIACLIIGIAGDATLVNVNLLAFDPYPSIFGSPLWMVALWMNFGLMLRPLFTWFLDNCWRSILGFSIGGLIAYISGEKLEVLTFIVDYNSHIGVALEWAIAGIVLRYLHLKFPSHSLS
tara:strand:+ start:614 stop:1141 length:528 start_codon:yes stop_codon:yes gene_type:complete